MEPSLQLVELQTEIKIIKIIIGYLSSQLAKWRAKLKNKEAELKVCQDLVKVQKKN